MTSFWTSFGLVSVLWTGLLCPLVQGPNSLAGILGLTLGSALLCYAGSKWIRRLRWKAAAGLIAATLPHILFFGVLPLIIPF